MNKLTQDCSKKDSEELIGGVVRKHIVTESRASSISESANKAGQEQ
jgi:hypothetical protein